MFFKRLLIIILFLLSGCATSVEPAEIVTSGIDGKVHYVWPEGSAYTYYAKEKLDPNEQFENFVCVTWSPYNQGYYRVNVNYQGFSYGTPHYYNASGPMIFFGINNQISGSVVESYISFVPIQSDNPQEGFNVLCQFLPLRNK